MERKRNDNGLAKRDSSVLASPLDSIEEECERRILTKLVVVMESTFHPLHEAVEAIGSSLAVGCYVHMKKKPLSCVF